MAEVVVRSVFESNLEDEFMLIDSVLKNYPIVSFDTEFPGTVLEPEKPFYKLRNDEKYMSMKNNVNASKIIQLGLCLSDTRGNLPNLGSDCSYIWEFNFRGFDEKVDAQNPASIQLLKDQGIDFEKNKKEGVDVGHFALLFLASGLGAFARSVMGHGGEVRKITWVLFHSVYDIGYLIKILIQGDLPDDQSVFGQLVFFFLGFFVYDVKEIASPLGMHGGLEKVAQNLGVSREAGEAHQAGSDSLLTMRAFLRLREIYFSGRHSPLLQQFNHKLYGLEDADFAKVQQGLAMLRQKMKSSSAAAAADNNRVKMFPIFARHPPPPLVPFPHFAIARVHPVTGGFPVMRRPRMVPMGAMAPQTLY